MAGLAWNLSRIERIDATDELLASIRADAAQMGVSDHLEGLVARARAMGPRESRLLTQVLVRLEDGEVRVTAASVRG